MSLVKLPLIQHAEDAPDQVDAVGLKTALDETVSGEVRFDRLSRALYSTDASVHQIVPLGVVIPKTDADVVAVVKACARYHVPITARGGGTSQAGQAIGPGVLLDFSKYMNAVLEINPAERWVRVQPGCVLDDLNLALKPHGLQFAPDVSTSNRATLGGMIANNSSGAHSIIYGKTVDHVLEIKAVLADGSMIEARALTEDELDKKTHQHDQEGVCYRTVQRLAEVHAEEIERRYPKILRRVGGYNLDLFAGRAGGVNPSVTSHDRQAGGVNPPVLAYGREHNRGVDTPRSPNLVHLFVGSEGTLAVTLEAKLRLVPLPKAKALLVIHFADLLDALAATPSILTHQPSAVEVVDKYVLDSTRINTESARLRDFLHGDPQAILIVEFYGEGAEDLQPRLDALEAELRQRGAGYHWHRSIGAAEQQRIWKLRKMALGLSMAQKGDAKAISFVEDTAVAPEKLRDYIVEFLALVSRHGTTAGVYAHASVGCLHVRPVINLKTTAGVRQFESIAAEVADLVLKYGGALSGEHGDGLVRSPFQEKMFGPVLYNAFRELKYAFDPQNVLNPGKIVDAPPLTANLRYGPAYATPDVETTFDFSADGGIVQAAELCSGVGACRKKREGTMCPSYQATRDEQHTTRGRANALRLALTGQLGLEGLTDPAVKEVLDLCLECKACKSECPTNVDMARLKAEFLHQYFKKHGFPFRNRIFGNIGPFSSMASSIAPSVANFLVGNRNTRWLNEKLFGIDRRRVPPKLARSNLFELFIEEHKERAAGAGEDHVLLFPDTFTTYYEPHIGMAAVSVLERLGVTVTLGLPRNCVDLGLTSQVPPHRLYCCGRPLISNGLLDKAVLWAENNIERLYFWAAVAKQPIIACEPSCILTIKDDYPALLRGDKRRKAEIVAAACQTFEEYVEYVMEKKKATGKAQIGFKKGPERILVQGHCHQRSLVGSEPMLRLLRRIPRAEVIDLDCGCCGMAGSFGYEKEHYEVSRLVGEQRLFPAVRQATADTVIVASGFSCRGQIEHFTGRESIHPAQLLQALAFK